MHAQKNDLIDQKTLPTFEYQSPLKSFGKIWQKIAAPHIVKPKYFLNTSFYFIDKEFKINNEGRHNKRILRSKI